MYSPLFWILACICHAMMERIANQHGHSIFRRASSYGFWGKNSWTRKYRDNNPQAGPLFWGSTTFLVFLTDGYHLTQWLMFWFLAAAVLTFDYTMYITGPEAFIAVFIIYRLGWALLFWLFHDFILRR